MDINTHGVFADPMTVLYAEPAMHGFMKLDEWSQITQGELVHIKPPNAKRHRTDRTGDKVTTPKSGSMDGVQNRSGIATPPKVRAWGLPPRTSLRIVRSPLHTGILDIYPYIGSSVTTRVYGSGLQCHIEIISGAFQ